MQAVEVTEYGGPEVLAVVDRPEPEPDAGEVVIDIELIGVNFADVEKRRGAYPDGPEPPYVPGIEVMGTVAMVGDGCSRTVGERVAALPETGGYAERVAVPANRLLPAPPGLDDATAAGYPVQWLTAHCALNWRGDLVADEIVLVHAAAGGVGSAAVQLAGAIGATVIGTASTASKRELAADAGCSAVLDSTTDGLLDRVMAETQGAGVDLVLDGVGGRAFEDSVRGLASGGRIVSYGVASGDVPVVATPRLLFDNRSVHGFHLEETLRTEPGVIDRAVDGVLRRLGGGSATVDVDRSLDLGEAAAGHRALENRETIGKVLLEP